MDDLKGKTERGGFPERKFDSAVSSGALATWVSPTSQGYFVQWWSKFGGVEMCKTRSAMGISKQDAWKNRDFIILGGSAVAEFVTDAFFGPYEACRFRSVSDPRHANGMLTTGQKENDLVNILYSKFGPMLFRQTPYTMVKISVQQKMAETIYQNLGTPPSEMSNDVLPMLSLVSDIVTDVVSLAECPDSEFNLESYLKDLVTEQDALAFHVCPIQIKKKKRMRSNTTITGDHKKTVFPDAILPAACQACPRTQTTSPHKWQIRTAHQSNEKFICGDCTTEFENDHIFEFANEDGKTISIKCEGSCHIRRS